MPSPNEITTTADLQQKIDDQVRILKTRNETAIYNYEQELADWKRNRDLYIAAKKPVPPKPERPKIRTFNKQVWLDLFLKFHLSVIATIGHSIPSGEFDGSPAYTEEEYISPNEPDAIVVTPSISNPIGKHSTGNRYDVTAGYKPRDGEVFEPLGEAGPKFVATVIAGPFGNWQWWTLTRP